MEQMLQHSRNVNENPCNMCMPMGAILPFKGLEGAMVIIHGSQGCSTYMRRHIAEHFNEPVDVGSSSLNEKGTIYGGEKNLCQAMENIQRVYQPKVIGVLTSCLAETIGEDIERIASEYSLKKGMEEFPILTVPTPGYGGTHSEGYLLAVRRIVEQLAQPTQPHNRVNVIIPHISPADIRELKRIFSLMGLKYTLLPDFSDTLDSPVSQPYRKIPQGGTKLEEVRAMSGAPATLELGLTAPEEYSAGKYLEKAFQVPLYTLPLPVGVENTDVFLQRLSKLTGKPVPLCLQKERGRLLDGMIDSHKYSFQGRSVIYGEPEWVYALTRTCIENGIFPKVVASGSNTHRLEELLNPILKKYQRQVVFLSETDFVQIRKTSVELGVNLAIGHSDGRYLTEKEGIPLVRVGFPIHDRVGGQRLLTLGYTGTMQFLDRVVNTLLEAKYKTYRQKMLEDYYVPRACKK